MTNLVELNKDNATVVFVTNQKNLVLEVITDNFRGKVLINTKYFNKIRTKGSIEGVLIDPYNSNGGIDKLFLGFSFN